jgi:hypothetical protein
MNGEFVQETVEIESTPRTLGYLTGWEAIVFELEDDPGPEFASS